MGNYLKGEVHSTIYKQFISVGASADRAGLTASLKPVWTDDGGSSANLAPFQLSTAAISMNTTKQLQFRDTAIYLNSSTDGQLDIVADGEVQVTTAAFDVNASGAVTIDGSSVGVTGTTTLNSATTVSGALTCSSTTALNGITTLGSGIALRVGAAEEYISGDTNNLTIASGVDINLTATDDINIPGSVGLTFGADTEKIEGTGSNVLALVAAGALNMTGADDSTWKTTAGFIRIDAEAAALNLDGHSGVNIEGNSGEIDITTTGALDLNSGAFTLDASTMSIDLTGGASNITSTTDSSAEDFTIAVAGATDSSLILKSSGTGTDAIQILATAGGIDILSSTGGNIDIAATNKSVTISSSENVSDAIVLSASAGGIDITSAGSAGEDIDISTSSSINLTSTENAANALYFRANGGTSETIKIHADLSEVNKAIEILSDAGGVDIQAGKTAYGIKIGNETSGLPVLIGHTTSEVTFGQNVDVTGTLTTGTFAPSVITLSHASDPILTINNAEHAGTDGQGHCTIIFAGEDNTGDVVAQRAKIVAAHDGSADDESGYLAFHTNNSGEGTSPGVALTLYADNTAVFTGDTNLSATKKLHLGGDTYLHEVSADKLDVVVGAYTLLELSENGSASANYMAIQEGNKFYLDGGSDTFIQNSASNEINFFCNDIEILALNTHSEISLSNNDAGTSNTIFGKNAGNAIQSDGNYNICIGEDAGGAITTGDASVLIGFEAGYTQSSHEGNVYIGYRAGKLSTAEQNVAIGHSAGDALAGGSDSVFVGHNAGGAANSSSGNTFVGSSAGSTTTTGDNNTVVGFGAAASAVGGTNQTIIGYDAQGQGDNYAVIGDGNTTRVYGSDDAGATFYGAGQSWSDKRIKENVKGISLGLDFVKDLNPVTFNKKQPADYTQSLKSKIYPKGTKRKMRVLDDEEKSKVRTGFLAQDVLATLKKHGLDDNNDVVLIDPDTTQHSMDYSKLGVVLVKAVQELSKRVEELEKS